MHVGMDEGIGHETRKGTVRQGEDFKENKKEDRKVIARGGKVQRASKVGEKEKRKYKSKLCTRML